MTRRLTAKLYRYGSDITAPIGNANSTWTERRGVLLRIEGDQGRRAYGEASPLPGYSSDSLEDCVRALEHWIERVPEPESTVDTVNNVEWTLGQLEKASENIPVELPAARCAVQVAMWSWLAQRQGLSPADLLNPSPQAEVPLTRWVTGQHEKDWLHSARQALASGYQSLKFKCGPDNLDPLLSTLSQLRAEFGIGISLRLDANRSLAPDAFDDNASAWKDLGIDFLEEPFGVPNVRVELPTAWDESLRDQTATELANTPTGTIPAALVIKPMVLGGITASVAYARAARAIRAEPIVSHCLGGPVDMAACCELACALQTQGVPAGLDHHDALETWLPLRLSPSAGTVWQHSTAAWPVENLP